MRRGNIRQWETLERWSPMLYLLAGILLIGYAALNVVATFTDTAFTAVEDVVGPAGFLLGFVGALGLYPGLAHRSPKLARAGAVCIGLGAVGFSVIMLQGLAAVAGVASTSSHGVFFLLVTIGMIPGYLSLGVASYRADVHSRIVGLFLVVPAVVFATMLSQAVLFVQFGLFSESTMLWSAFAISSAQALAHLTLGSTLRTGVSQTEHEAPSVDGVVS